VPAVLARAEHQRPHRADGRQHLLVGRVAELPPRVEAGEETRLGLPQVPDPAQVPLVEQRVADAASRIVGAETAQERALVELVREDVRAEPGDAVIEARARVRHELKHRAAELHDLMVRRPDHEPGPARRLAPAPPAFVDAPPPRHAQVGVDREVAVEADEEVLPPGLDRAHAAPAEPLGPAVALEAPVRSLEGDDLRADQCGPDPPCGAVDRVALGHARRSA
jgi:hypothetical protein